MNWILRIQEWNADGEAVAQGYGHELISALAVIYVSNELCLDPHDMFSILNNTQSHPHLATRLTRIRQQLERKEDIKSTLSEGKEC